LVAAGIISNVDVASPNVGPKPEYLTIAAGWSVTRLLNGPRPSFLRSEKINELEVKAKSKKKLDSERTKK